ncbi:hypothetical protein B566_EDAN013033 [Ephemera danica]|nr:hypothetical protein B566_EDAN013033 [Ephemera danica]
MRVLFTDPKVKTVPESSVPVQKIVDAEHGSLPSPDRSPVVATASPKCRLIEQILAKLNKIKQHNLIVNQQLTLEKELADAIADADSKIALLRSIFVLNNHLTDCGLAPRVIMKGTQIISIEVGKLIFIDSFPFIPLSLLKFIETFNLTPLFKTGYFSHLLTVTDNQCYGNQTEKLNISHPMSCHQLCERNFYPGTQASGQGLRLCQQV